MGERDLALQKCEVRGAAPMQIDTFGGPTSPTLDLFRTSKCLHMNY